MLHDQGFFNDRLQVKKGGIFVLLFFPAISALLLSTSDVSSLWVSSLALGLLMLLQALIHEAAHGVVAKFFGSELKALVIRPYAFGMLTLDEDDNLNYKKNFFSALAGPAADFMAGIFVAVYMLMSVEATPMLVFFFMWCWVSCIGNLFIPIPGSDGWRVFKALRHRLRNENPLANTSV